PGQIPLCSPPAERLLLAAATRPPDPEQSQQPIHIRSPWSLLSRRQAAAPLTATAKPTTSTPRCRRRSLHPFSYWELGCWDWPGEFESRGVKTLLSPAFHLLLFPLSDSKRISIRSGRVGFAQKRGMRVVESGFTVS